jgi:hypothetical protein
MAVLEVGAGNKRLRFIFVSWGLPKSFLENSPLFVCPRGKHSKINQVKNEK